VKVRLPDGEVVFVPHAHCTDASGGCLVVGRCLGQCTAQRRRNHEKRIRELERRLVEMELKLCRLRADRGSGRSEHDVPRDR